MGLEITLNETNWTQNVQYSILYYVSLNFLGMHVYNWKWDHGMATTDLSGKEEREGSILKLYYDTKNKVIVGKRKCCIFALYLI